MVSGAFQPSLKIFILLALLATGKLAAEPGDLAADFVTGLVPATIREQVRVWTGRSWSATANHLDELGKAGLIVESAAGIEVTVYPQISDPRGNREALRVHREQLALTAKSLAPTAKPTCENADTITRTRTTVDGDRYIDGEWV